MDPNCSSFLLGKGLMMFGFNVSWIDHLQVDFAHILDLDSLGFNVKVLPLFFFFFVDKQPLFFLLLSFNLFPIPLGTIIILIFFKNQLWIGQMKSLIISMVLSIIFSPYLQLYWVFILFFLSLSVPSFIKRIKIL